MRAIVLIGLVGAAATLSLSAVEAKPRGAAPYAQSPTYSQTTTAPGRSYDAPGQMMLRDRTQANSPSNSFNAPGQRMLRDRVR